MSRGCRRGQTGQTLFLVAILSGVLAGFVGLVIDGGQVVAQQQLARSAADGAALAGAYAIARQGASLPAATSLARQVVSQDGLPVADLTLTYLDSTGAVTANAASTANVRAVVTDARSTYFISVLGIRSVQVSATAQASTGPCAMCVMPASRTSLTIGASSTGTVTGAPLVVNSTASPNIQLNSSAALSAPSI